MPWLIALIGEVAVKLLTNIITKGFLLALIVIVLPNVLLKLYLHLIQWTFQYINTYLAGQSLQPAVIELTGFGGWIAGQMHLVECFSIFSTFLIIKFTLGFFRL